MSEMRQYRKKPVVIDAVQWDGTDESAATIAAAFDVDAKRLGFGGGVLDVVTLEGGLSASPGDWIIRGVRGELYPCKPDIFAETYEPVGASPPAGSGEPDEVERLRAALEELFPASEGFTEAFDDLERLGLIVPVPADEAFSEEWDSDTMYVWAWSSLAGSPKEVAAE